ncbi:MAG: phosphoribosylglycinamide formyltransferase [Wenzhouxiangellaceae bacterium]|nr:phosphoribosylglycinamide formyltransferase [Wenzhouxiangellaceae bacterium]MBS3746674.1 phosphoribosylglycinamide formyltransferase [Wenzhouxiangellaceae bacterium]MBS3822694.1 phosphoribosylglycinamide formyltransferase [Wenzhouxiangellaceae bacterium]
MSGEGLVVLVSGRGSNALAIIDAAACGALPIPVHAVIADRPAAGLERAAERSIDTAMLPRGAFPGRSEFETALSEAIAGYRPKLIALAGFMRVLSAEFVERHAGRMVNIHPSLLPKYRGLDTHARALEAGDAEHGASIHWVTPELDAGPVIAQARVPVREDDDAQILAERVLEQEHRLYPAALALLLANPVETKHESSPNRTPPVLDRDFDAAGRQLPSCS